MVDIAIIILILQAVGTVAGSWLVAELLIRLITRGLKRAHAPQTLIQTIRDGLTVIWIALAATVILTITGIASTFSFLTISGIAGVALSLALQNTLSNIINGILIVSDGVLRLNDSVEFLGVKGVVVRIGLRATWVKTEAGNIAVISNNNLASGPLVNYTAVGRLEKKLRV